MPLMTSMPGERFPRAATFSLMHAAAAAPWLPSVRAVAARPWLWRSAFRQVARLAPKGWWRQRPFLPVPPAAYLGFREVTAYGGEQGEPAGAGGLRPPEPEDVCTYLAWCDEFPRARA
jgi:hypothetical protein